MHASTCVFAQNSSKNADMISLHLVVWCPLFFSNRFFSTTWKAKYNFLCPYTWINLASSWLLSWLFSSWLSISLNWVYVALLRLWCLKENRLSFAKAWYYYCYFCEKLFLPFYLLKDYVSTKLFSSNCRPLCGLIFLLIWFLSRQLTLYFRSRRWLKTLHHIFLVTTVRSFLCFSLHKFLSLTASGWWDQIHKALTSSGSICRGLLSRPNHQKSNLSLEQA